MTELSSPAAVVEIATRSPRVRKCVALAAWTTTLERILDAQRNLACADRAVAHDGLLKPSGCRRDGDCNPQETESI